MILSKLKTFQILRTLSNYIYIKTKREKYHPVPISQFYQQQQKQKIISVPVLQWHYKHIEN